MSANETKEKIEIVAERLFENATRIRYGMISASLKIHNGRIVDVTHTLTESTREKEERNEA